MANQHTPGPWKWDESRDEIFDHDGAQIAAIQHYRVADEAISANARLIASAPELLEALKRFASAMEQRSYPELQGVASDAFAAIAKAEGKGC